MGFADSFLQGLMAGRAEQERKKQLAFQQQDAEERHRRQAEQDKVLGVIRGRDEAKDLMGLLTQQDMPRQEMPPGQMGPEAPAPRQMISIPTFSGQTLQVPARYREDVAAQERAKQDLEDQRFQARQELVDRTRRIELPPELAAKIGVAPGLVDPQVVSAATQILNAEEGRKDRAAARQNAAAATAGAAGEKRTAMDAAVGAYVDALRDGSATIESIPTTLRGQVLAAAAKAGVRPLARKELEQVKAIQSFEDQAGAIAAGFKPGAVGPLEGRIPNLFSGRDTAAFRADVQGMFNELGKLRSGGAITPQEYERLAAELPAVTDTEQVFQGKMQRFLTSLARKRQSLLAPVDRSAGGSQENNDPLGLGL